MQHLSNDHKDHPNQHNNSLKLCNKTGDPVVNLTESQWKLRQQHDKTFPMEGNYCRTNTSIQRKTEILKSSTVTVTAWDLSRKVNHLSKIV